MNGAPMPPDPTAPPDWFLFAVFAIGIVLLVGWLIFEGTRELHKQKLEDKQEVLAQAIAQEKEEMEHLRIQTLINQSPGGRKPWQ